MPSAASTTSALSVRNAIRCLDLTRLNSPASRSDVEQLAASCETLRGVQALPAAVCVWHHQTVAARRLVSRDVRVAAVANFPDGMVNLERAVSDVRAIVDRGGDEVDLVFPWRAFLTNPEQPVIGRLLDACRRACGSRTLKVILESSELPTPELLQQASRLALRSGADFLKTSTGKAAGGATLPAAEVMLRTIVEQGNTAGFKASGGVRRWEDAKAYMALTASILGTEALRPERFRIGASSLLDELLVLCRPATVSRESSVSHQADKVTEGR